MEKNRLNWIDIAKGICMIAVFLGHLGVEKLGFVYSFHLTVFFILSGSLSGSSGKIPFQSSLFHSRFLPLHYAALV